MQLIQDSAVSGACAGLASAVLTCPLDVVKTQLQAQGAFSPGTALTQGFRGQAGGVGGGVGGGLNHHLVPNPAHVARAIKAAALPVPPGTVRGIVAQIWAQDGVRGFYHGLGPTVLGYLPTWAIYFTIYDEAKQRLIHSDLGIDMQVGGHILSAMLAGAASTVITSPVWVVKTRFMLQALRRPGGGQPYRNTLDTFARIYREEGVGAFYKGLTPSLMGVSHVAVQFPLYDNLKRMLHQYLGRGPEETLAPSEILACSTVSKMVASCLTYPHEVLRTRLQMQTNRFPASSRPPPSPSAHDSPLTRRIGLVDMIKQIWHNDGLRGFYKGMGINLFRTLPNSAVTILTYELMMQHFRRAHAQAGQGDEADHHSSH